MSSEIYPTARQKEEFSYFYYYQYYPTRFNVSEELDTIRKIIWAFKDGNISKEIANGFVEDLNHFLLTQPLNSWWLCVIPASTKEKTNRRFKVFCEAFCGATEINNGFDLIINKSDRVEKHTASDRNEINILDAMEFNNIAGKKILLFDDVYTTGKSFLKVARRLKALGAIEVKGLFLGKTHWLEE